jgi:hypothetical protein
VISPCAVTYRSYRTANQVYIIVSLGLTTLVIKLTNHIGYTKTTIKAPCVGLSNRRACQGVTQLRGERLAGRAVGRNRQGSGEEHRFDLIFLASFFASRQRMKWGSGQSPGCLFLRWAIQGKATKSDKEDITLGKNLLKMEKEDFKQKARESIDEIFARIDELEAKKDVVFDKAKEEYQETIGELKAKKDELQAKFKRLVEGSDDEWDEVQNAFSSAKDSLKEGFSKMANLFKKVVDGTPDANSSAQTGKPADDPNPPKGA